MEDLEALLKDLESSGTPQKCPQNPPGTPPGQGSGGDPEQLYSSVRRPRPLPGAPPPPGLGELERLLRDLSGTRSGSEGELLAPPPPDEPKIGGSPPGRDSGPPPGPPKSGGGSPKSAASEELERLLETLTELQVQPQPPPGQELESLLLQLQEELWDRGDKHLGQPKGAPRCERCQEPVLGAVVTALGRWWHPEHFCCCHCGAVLGEQGFQERGGFPFCPRDFGALFAPRCRGCREPVLAQFVSALGGLWHPPCFVCQDCRAPFPGGSFFQLGGVPLCQRHFRERGEGQGWGRG